MKERDPSLKIRYKKSKDRSRRDSRHDDPDWEGKKKHRDHEREKERHREKERQREKERHREKERQRERERQRQREEMREREKEILKEVATQPDLSDDVPGDVFAPYTQPEAPSPVNTEKSPKKKVNKLLVSSC